MLTNLLQAMAHGGMVHPAQNHQEFIAAIAAHKLVLRRSGAQFLGKIADILIVNTENSFFLSPGNFLSNFIYSAHSDCIEYMIANGKFVMRNRKVKDEAQIIANAQEQLIKITH